MINRSQTYYLIIAILILIYLIFSIPEKLPYNMIFIITYWVIIFLNIIAIFLYDNRSLQSKLVGLTTILLLIITSFLLAVKLKYYSLDVPVFEILGIIFLDTKIL